MKSQKGFSLVEVLISLAILGLMGAAFLGGLATTSQILFTTNDRETAKNLAEFQMEYVKGLGYATTYDPAPVPDEYADYTATVNVESVTSRDSRVQKVIVAIQHSGEEVVTLEGYKVM